MIVALALFRPHWLRGAGVFAFTLGVLVFVHEWGHYQFARWAGMKVNRFAVGFPPWIYTWRRNDIDYSIGALPIGGMVDIAGLGSEEEMVATAKGDEVAEPTRERNVRAPYGQRQFQDANLGWRFMTLFAGPLMNFVLAMVLFVGLYSLVGEAVPESIKTINRVRFVQPGNPADKAGIQVGDLLVGVNDTRTSDTKQLKTLIEKSKGASIKVFIERDGKVQQRTLNPIIEPNKDETGQPILDKSGKPVVSPIIGIGFDYDYNSVQYRRLGLVESMKRGVEASLDISRQIITLVGKAVTFRLSPEERKGVGGPIKIAEVTVQASENSAASLFEFMAKLSVNLGLMNLLPFPALDGGRILFLGYELVARRPIDPRKESIVHMAGMVALLAFMLFITVRDIWPMIERGLGKAF